MAARGEITILDGETRREVTVMPNGVGWAYFCTDAPYVLPVDRCRFTVVGYNTRSQAIRAAEAHLRWHVIGKPMCERCDSTLSRKGAKRCRRGTCPAEER